MSAIFNQLHKARLRSSWRDFGEAKSPFAKAIILVSGLRPPKYDVALATADEGGGSETRTRKSLRTPLFESGALPIRHIPPHAQCTFSLLYSNKICGRLQKRRVLATINLPYAAADRNLIQDHRFYRSIFAGIMDGGANTGNLISTLSFFYRGIGFSTGNQ